MGVTATMFTLFKSISSGTTSSVFHAAVAVAMITMQCFLYMLRECHVADVGASRDVAREVKLCSTAEVLHLCRVNALSPTLEQPGMLQGKCLRLNVGAFAVLLFTLEQPGTSHGMSQPLLRECHVANVGAAMDVAREAFETECWCIRCVIFTDMWAAKDLHRKSRPSFSECCELKNASLPTWKQPGKLHEKSGQ